MGNTTPIPVPYYIRHINFSLYFHSSSRTYLSTHQNCNSPSMQSKTLTLVAASPSSFKQLRGHVPTFKMQIVVFGKHSQSQSCSSISALKSFNEAEPFSSSKHKKPLGSMVQRARWDVWVVKIISLNNTPGTHGNPATLPGSNPLLRQDPTNFRGCSVNINSPMWTSL